MDLIVEKASILLSNTRINKWPLVVKTLQGFQPLEKGDAVVGPQEVEWQKK